MPQMEHCPFHDDEHPSLAIYEDSFYCFAASCNRYGTLEELKAALGGKKISVKTASQSYAEGRKKKVEKLTVKPEDSINAFKQFLEDRKLTDKDIFSVGGELDLNEKPGYLWLPTVEGRIGRNLIEGGDRPRYLVDGVPLFGSLEADRLFLTEGPFDALQMQKAGFPSVSGGGANPSPEALFKIKDKTLYILFDSDFAGWTGARKVAETLDKFRSRYQILDMPAKFGKDPQEALLKHPDRFTKWLNTQFALESEKEWLSRELGEVQHYIPTGIGAFDRKLEGIAPSSIIGITGKPAAGKSAFAIALSRNIAEQGKTVGYCTYEISKRQIYSRLLSPFIGREWKDLEKSGLTAEGMQKLAHWPLMDKITVKVSPGLGEILMLADSSDVLVIDYAQCVPIRDSDLHRGFRNFMESLIELSVKHNKVIILLSSMARAAYSNLSTMAVFKDFGDLEYRLALVMRLIRKGRDAVSPLQIRVLKNTRGWLGKLNINFDYAYNREEDNSPPWE